MKDLKTDIIANWVKGSVLGSTQVQGVKVDSRAVEAGDLFVCLKGARVDGHDYIEDVIGKGAVAVLVDHKIDNLDVCQIIVDDTMAALQLFAKAYRDTLNATFIGITGSNGKTSTKDILFSILSRVGNSIATYKNQNTEIGTYLNLFRMNDDTEFGIFEMGLDYVGDVAVMAECIRPDAGLVMSLAPAHMMNFDSIEHIASEKMRIFDFVTHKDLSFYQGDFEQYRSISHGEHTFGFNEDNEWVVSDVSSNNHGISFKLDGVAYSSNLLGNHQASNCAGVIALLSKLGIDDAVIREGLNHVALTSLRTELVEKGNALVLLDAYKSNPISAKYALDLLAHYEYDGDRVAILSDMVELGPESHKAHLEVLDCIQDLNIKMVHTLGPEFKKALSDSRLDALRFTNDDTFEAFVERVTPCFDEHAMILIKGSRSYQLERLMEEVK
ncbi:UDP-N-acetylmuramoyl-tripeptide--D-alanyl-D-alanine ligase [Erysipelothrix rhusiopathiae]|nr:UDP-N-acetylmuramoyl-tripeptide--D-alanyl-D-alanine ligase [Erysipelothrix rhusiopathiae]MDE8037413.1 UDP-N-acetylmuramoyl-tripeptide--D-alanyl-D-alanine ligase [Erysipelothrix rhusiopathiae]MDE8038796.1 UDP-N-acetylmuramoyl-tripeptide--D-alanyl-D-alanine ligase [Erysipelothrix rhusiopathiae]MDE8040978.1 UDP-N-acetylmuramoyl-tripeptide--D-alanyl-D-alanine ligase [Erysipelothrix rhusiopathiae]MDE8042617.1 UDP-N-acetylmuramoyl-tripeptide--D-alanyl-D-alanine ligase [Erysipelothrix rhusiopathiae